MDAWCGTRCSFGLCASCGGAARSCGHGYKPKVHNIEDLGKRAGDLHPALRNVFPRGTPEEDRLFKLIKRADIDARYDPSFAITKEEPEAIAVHVSELRSRVEMVCRERIEAMAVEMPG